MPVGTTIAVSHFGEVLHEMEAVPPALLKVIATKEECRRTSLSLLVVLHALFARPLAEKNNCLVVRLLAGKQSKTLLFVGNTNVKTPH